MNPWIIAAWTSAICLSVLVVAINTAIIVAVVRALRAAPKEPGRKEIDHTTTILSTRNKK